MMAAEERVCGVVPCWYRFANWFEGKRSRELTCCGDPMDPEGNRESLAMWWIRSVSRLNYDAPMVASWKEIWVVKVIGERGGHELDPA